MNDREDGNTYDIIVSVCVCLFEKITHILLLSFIYPGERNLTLISEKDLAICENKQKY